MEVYDPQADSWQRTASTLQCLYFHAAAAMGGKIYVTGGSQAGSASSACVYDPQADVWASLASMSIGRQLHAAAAVGGKLYVFGGWGAGGCGLGADARRPGGLRDYDPASDSWAQVGRARWPLRVLSGSAVAILSVSR